MAIRNFQLPLTQLKLPLLSLIALAQRTMAITTGKINVPLCSTILALEQLAAHPRGLAYPHTSNQRDYP